MNIHTFEITCKLSGYRYKKIHRDLMACGSDYYKNKCKALRDKGYYGYHNKKRTRRWISIYLSL